MSSTLYLSIHLSIWWDSASPPFLRLAWKSTTIPKINRILSCCLLSTSFPILLLFLSYSDTPLSLSLSLSPNFKMGTVIYWNPFSFPFPSPCPIDHLSLSLSLFGFHYPADFPSCSPSLSARLSTLLLFFLLFFFFSPDSAHYRSSPHHIIYSPPFPLASDRPDAKLASSFRFSFSVEDFLYRMESW